MACIRTDSRNSEKCKCVQLIVAKPKGRVCIPGPSLHRSRWHDYSNKHPQQCSGNCKEPKILKDCNLFLIERDVGSESALLETSFVKICEDWSPHRSWPKDLAQLGFGSKLMILQCFYMSWSVFMRLYSHWTQCKWLHPRQVFCLVCVLKDAATHDISGPLVDSFLLYQRLQIVFGLGPWQSMGKPPEVCWSMLSSIMTIHTRFGWIASTRCENVSSRHCIAALHPFNINSWTSSQLVPMQPVFVSSNALAVDFEILLEPLGLGNTSKCLHAREAEVVFLECANCTDHTTRCFRYMASDEGSLQRILRKNPHLQREDGHSQHQWQDAYNTHTHTLSQDASSRGSCSWWLSKDSETQDLS